MSRAFKPMPKVLELVNQNIKKFKNIIFFMGNSGKKTLNDTLKIWDLDYEEKKSLTNNNSFIINIKKIEKKKFHENNFNNKSKRWSWKNNNCD